MSICLSEEVECVLFLSDCRPATRRMELNWKQIDALNADKRTVVLRGNELGEHALRKSIFMFL